MATKNYPLTPLGVLFQAALERSGLTQSEVCARAGTSPSNWNIVLYGGRELHGQFYAVRRNNAELIAKIAFVLGVDIREALALRGYTLDQVKALVYDLSHVPLKQLQAELRRRDKAKVTAEDQEKERFEDEFQAAVEAVDRDEPQPMATRPRRRHAEAEKPTGT